MFSPALRFVKAPKSAGLRTEMGRCWWRTWGSCFTDCSDAETFRGRVAGDGVGGFSPSLSLKWPDRAVSAVQPLQLNVINLVLMTRDKTKIFTTTSMKPQYRPSPWGLMSDIPWRRNLFEGPSVKIWHFLTWLGSVFKAREILVKLQDPSR